VGADVRIGDTIAIVARHLFVPEPQRADGYRRRRSSGYARLLNH
jgi:hypothetical protein